MIWQMSLYASALIIVIVIARALAARRMPRVVVDILWGVALCRLLIPFSVSVKLSLFTPREKAAGSLFDNSAVAAAKEFAATIEAFANYDISSSPLSPTSAEASSLSSLLPLIWGAGLLICVLCFLIPHLRCRVNYQAALPVSSDYVRDWLSAQNLRRAIDVRESDTITAPLTYGLWKPVILLPKTTDWKNEPRLRHILVHEITHIQRFDILIKWLLTAAVCVHWFNPLVWVMFLLANRDMEISCDRRAIRALGEAERGAYARGLIELEENRSSMLPIYNHFAKNAVEERIVVIMQTRKHSLTGIVLAVLLTLGATSVFAISAPGGDPYSMPEEATKETGDAPDQELPSWSGGGWAADDIDAYVFDAETGEWLYRLPKYSDLYPGKELPKVTLDYDQYLNVDIETASEQQIMALAGVDIESAPEWIREKIFEAGKVIFNNSRLVEDGYSFQRNPGTGIPEIIGP